MSQATGEEPDSDDETDGAEQAAVATMELATEEDRAKVQNETVNERSFVDGGPLSVVSGPLSEVCCGASGQPLGSSQSDVLLQGAILEGVEETAGPAHCGVGDPLRTEVVDEEQDSGDDADEVEQDAVATVGLATEGDRAKIQNEIWPGSNAGDTGTLNPDNLLESRL